jgi:hypothetical protein
MTGRGDEPELELTALNGALLYPLAPVVLFLVVAVHWSV